MKGKLVETVKKWWMIVLVATLALSLTSCGRRRTSRLMNGGLPCGDNYVSVLYGIFPLSNSELELVIVPEMVSNISSQVYIDTLRFEVTDDYGGIIDASEEIYIEDQQPAVETPLFLPKNISGATLWVDYYGPGIEGGFHCSLSSNSGSY